MKTISEKTYSFRSAVGGSTHDWEAIIKAGTQAGKLGVLIAGEDYTGKTSTMSTLLRSQARKRGYTCKIGKKEDGLVYKLTAASNEQKAQWAEQDAERKALKAAAKAEANGDSGETGDEAAE